MIDPINTTASDGRPCVLCGADASGVDVIDGITQWTCQTCHTDQLFQCEDCDRTFLMAQGHRLYGTPSLYCGSCAAQHPKVIEGRMQALRRDEQRDDFNEVRR